MNSDGYVKNGHSPVVGIASRANANSPGHRVTFDVVEREVTIGDRPAVFYFVDGFIKDFVSLEIIRRLQETSRDGIVPSTVEKIQKRLVAYAEVTAVNTLDEAIKQILSGPLVLFFQGQREAIAIDVREYPVRSIEEPDLEKVTRGSHDGFTETIVFNTALIRRRLRDPMLRFELMTVGRRSETDVAVAYIEGITDPSLVKDIKKRINKVSVDALPTGAKALEGFIVGQPWHPLPRARYTERPDVAAAQLLEGQVLVIVDTTPMVMVLPTTMFQLLEHAEEYFQSPVIGTYLRFIRMAGFFATTFLTPLWVSLYFARERLGPAFDFIGPKEPSAVPVAVQLILLEIGIDLIRAALIHTPSSLATSLGIVGAILLGELAVEVGFFVPETILYTAIVAIGYFAIPSPEFAYSLRIFRYLLLVGAFIGGLVGVALVTVAGIILVVSTHSIAVPFLWPLIPFHGPSLLRVFIRMPNVGVESRPPVVQSRQRMRTQTKDRARKNLT